MLAYARSRGGGPTDDFLIVLNSSFLWRAPLLFLLYLEAAAAALVTTASRWRREREYARASYCHPGRLHHRIRGCHPRSLRGPAVVLVITWVKPPPWFSGIQRLQRDGVHSAHHCALSAAAVVAARGQGQRNLEFPEAVISVNWKKKMLLSTFFCSTDRKLEFHVLHCF